MTKKTSASSVLAGHVSQARISWLSVDPRQPIGIWRLLPHIQTPSVISTASRNVKRVHIWCSRNIS